MSKSCLFFLFLLTHFAIAAQQQKIDSLLRKLNNSGKTDTIRLDLLNSIAYEYQYINVAAGLKTADNAVALAQQLHDERRLAEAYLMKGENYFNQGKYKQAAELTHQSLDKFQQLQDKKGIANCLNNLGNISLELADYSASLQYFGESKALNEKLNSKKALAANIRSLGIVYKNLFDYAKAMELYQQAAIIYQQLNDADGLASCYNNTGNIYLQSVDYSKALLFYQRALKVYEPSGESAGLANTYANVGKIYYNLSDYATALSYYKKSMAINARIGKDTSHSLLSLCTVYEKISALDAIKCYLDVINISEGVGNKTILFSALNNSGFMYYKLSDYIKAWKNYENALMLGEQMKDKRRISLVKLSMGELCRDAPDSVLTRLGITPAERYNKTLAYFNEGKQGTIETYDLINERYAWEDLHITYERQQDYAKALDAYKNFIIIRDSIANNEKEKKIARLAMQYEFEKRADSLKLEERITDDKLKQQVLIASQQHQELTLNKNKLALSDKEKDLQRLAYLKTQSDLQNTQLKEEQKSKLLTLSEKEKQLQQAKVHTLIQQQALNKLRLQQQWVYSLAILVLLALASSWFIYKNRLKQQRLKTALLKEKAEQEKKDAAFQRNLADVSLTALRSQMNPHFIFNCLNSIKLYTAQNDTAAASEYLTKFSKLIRLVMENSRNDKISLASELNALHLYIEMEAMRFKEKLRYAINVENNVEKDYIEIPPLLLQPYVENAIWHGLMHKEEGGTIDVHVAIVNNNSLLQISITDNGIGRMRSAELKSKSVTRHKSYGMKVTSERIALINQIYKTGADVKIIDLTNDKGAAGGTKVIIQIPV